jgi:serine/threonine-protein kinase RsbT
LPALDKTYITSEDDLTFILYMVKSCLKSTPFSLIDREKIIVSVMELTRNVLDHAHGHGEFSFSYTDRIFTFVVKDYGPGIPCLEAVLNGSGQSPHSQGLGLGLSGARRLLDEFHISTSEKGTRIVAAKKHS